MSKIQLKETIATYKAAILDKLREAKLSDDPLPGRIAACDMIMELHKLEKEYERSRTN